MPIYLRCLYLILFFERVENGSLGEFGIVARESLFQAHNSHWLHLKNIQTVEPE